MVATDTTPPRRDALSALALNDGTNDVALDPAFAAGTTSYTANVANAVTQVTVAAAAAPGVAIVYRDGSNATLTDADGSTAGFQVALAEGANVIKVTVRSGDGTTSRTYTVTGDAGGGGHHDAGHADGDRGGADLRPGRRRARRRRLDLRDRRYGRGDGDFQRGRDGDRHAAAHPRRRRDGPDGELLGLGTRRRRSSSSPTGWRRTTRPADGIAIAANRLALNDGTIKAGTVDAALSHAALAAQPGHKVGRRQAGLRLGPRPRPTARRSPSPSARPSAAARTGMISFGRRSTFCPQRRQSTARPSC